MYSDSLGMTMFPVFPREKQTWVEVMSHQSVVAMSSPFVSVPLYHGAYCVELRGEYLSYVLFE